MSTDRPISGHEDAVLLATLRYAAVVDDGDALVDERMAAYLEALALFRQALRRRMFAEVIHGTPPDVAAHVIPVAVRMALEDAGRQRVADHVLLIATAAVAAAARTVRDRHR
jgi:hypothetical protein